MADIDLHAVKACKCLTWVLPEWSFHSSGSLSFLLSSLLSSTFAATFEDEAEAFKAPMTVLFVDSIVATYREKKCNEMYYNTVSKRAVLWARPCGVL